VAGGAVAERWPGGSRTAATHARVGAAAGSPTSPVVSVHPVHNSDAEAPTNARIGRHLVVSVHPVHIPGIGVNGVHISAGRGRGPGGGVHPQHRFDIRPEDPARCPSRLWSLAHRIDTLAASPVGLAAKMCRGRTRSG